MTLLVTRAGAAEDASRVAETAAALGVPLKVLEIDSTALHSLYGADYALVRPDGHVAWRGDSAARACAALPIAVGSATTKIENAAWSS